MTHSYALMALFVVAILFIFFMWLKGKVIKGGEIIGAISWLILAIFAALTLYFVLH